MKHGRPQAKDITDATMLDVVRATRCAKRVEEESGSSPTLPTHPQPPTTSPVANATFLAASHDGAWYLPDGAALTFAAATPTADDHRGVPATAKADGGSTTFLLFKSAPTPTPGAACDNGEPTTRQGVTVGHNATATATTTTAPSCCENAATIRKNSP